MSTKYSFEGFDTGKLVEINYNVAAILNDLGVKTIQNNEWLNLCCPLHNDKTPSAGVWLPYGIFRCFVCGSMSFPNLLHQWLDKTYDEIDEILLKYDNRINQTIDGSSLQSALNSARIESNNNIDSDILFSSWIYSKGIPLHGFDKCDELLSEYDEYYNTGNFELAKEYAQEVMLNG